MLSLKRIILQGDQKRALAFNIKQAIQGLFTAGTSEQKEKVGSKRGLKPLAITGQ